MCASRLRAGVLCVGLRMDHMHRHISVPVGTAWGGRAWQGTGGLPDACVRACVRSFVNAHVRLRARVCNVRACAGTGRRDQNLARLGHTVFVDDEQVSVRLRVGQRLLLQSRARPNQA